MQQQMMSVGDDILLGIQEQICAEAFPAISTIGAPKLKQQGHQWFSNDQKIVRVHQHFQQTRELHPSPTSIHPVQTQGGTRDGFGPPFWGEAQV